MKTMSVFTLVTLGLMVAGDGLTHDKHTPADTYFAAAVTENSHNHYGDNLLYLDFQERPNTAKIAPRVVISPLIEPGSITIDGNMDDWNPTYLSTIWARVMNNYPLSEFYDAVPGYITLGSAWDDQYIYFLVKWEDANHDSSTQRNLWLFDGSQWQKKKHVIPNEGAPAANAINRGDELTGKESEDRVFFMFPIRDIQRNFRDDGLGCSAYCHANLEHGGPLNEMIAEDVAAMHTTIPGDKADFWHWTSTRSLPSRTLKDGHLVYGIGSYNGRKGDQGNWPTVDNDTKKLGISKPPQPAYMSLIDFAAKNYGSSNLDRTHFEQHDAIPIQDIAFIEGDTIPYSISRPTSGSRGDVTAIATYDDETNMWTLELKRLLNTGDGDDYQFVPGTGAPPPNNPAAVIGDATRGEQLYKTHGCLACHQDKGQGLYDGAKWTFPRIQRTSGATILKTVRLNREMRGAVTSFIEEEMRKTQAGIMPDIRLTEQEAEDIATWLQQQFIPLGQ